MTTRAATVAAQANAGAPVTGPSSITVAFSEPVTGFELEDLVGELTRPGAGGRER